MKGKLANAVGSQYPSHYLETWCIQHYYRLCAHIGLASSRLNSSVFAERRNLVSGRVPSHFSWPLTLLPVHDLYQTNSNCNIKSEVSKTMKGRPIKFVTLRSFTNVTTVPKTLIFILYFSSFVFLISFFEHI